MWSIGPCVSVLGNHRSYNLPALAVTNVLPCSFCSPRWSRTPSPPCCPPPPWSRRVAPASPLPPPTAPPCGQILTLPGTRTRPPPPSSPPLRSALRSQLIIWKIRKKVSLAKKVSLFFYADETGSCFFHWFSKWFKFFLMYVLPSTLRTISAWWHFRKIIPSSIISMSDGYKCNRQSPYTYIM